MSSEALADGRPPRSAAAVLSRFGRLEAIRDEAREWHVNVMQAGTLAATLRRERTRVLLFRELATLRDDVALFGDVDELRWQGPTPAFAAVAASLDGKVASEAHQHAGRSASAKPEV